MPAWIVLLLGSLALAAGLRLASARARTPSGYWVGGWIAASIGGVSEVLAYSRPELRLLGFPLGSLFPWFVLAGALALGERRVPKWILASGLALGVARGVVAGLTSYATGYWLAFATDLPAVLAAAWLSARTTRDEPVSGTQRVLPFALVALAGAGALHLVWQAQGYSLERPLMLWVLVAPPVLAMQLRVGAEWGRRTLERERRALARTVAERTEELGRANASLRQSEERYRLVSELSSDLSFGFRVHADGRVEGEWVTDEFGRLTGFSVREMRGDAWLALIHPEDRPTVQREFGRIVETPTGTGTLLFRVVGKQGELRWLEARQRVLREPGGELRIVGAARDVTEARRSEAERFRLEREMQEAQRLESLGLVTGGVAHDFNNLLTVILGNGRLALAELPADDPVRPRLERMLRAAEHGAGLTEQMLAYAGRAPRAQKPVELSALVAEMSDLARATLPRGVTLHEELGASVWVLGDETQLRQVVLNLVANAGEAIGARRGRVEVRTAWAAASSEELAGALGVAELAPGRLALLEVSDDGAGMDEATRARVFEPFFTTKLSGRGLGLAAVLGIVRGHGGRVALDSSPERGSRFRVWLPSGDAALQSEGAAPSAGAARGPVLVIDDQEPVLELAREYLRRAGFETETADGGRAGLARFLASPLRWAAVVVDLAMPDLAGDELAAQIRRLRPELPLLLVSGHDLGAARCAELAPARFLRKPFEREELVAALTALVDAEAKAEGPAGR